MLNRISLRQMEYFVATAESGSIIIASEKIHVSSPSISAAIAHIESELQVQLFIRQHAKGLILTNIGEQVMKECQQILSQTGSLYSLAANFSGSIRGPLKLGCFTAFAPMLYAEIIHGFSNLYKSVDLDVCEGDQEILINGLLRNVLDVVLTYDLNIDENLLHFESLALLPPYALFSEEHPLAHAPAVTMEELAAYPMILLDMPYSNDYFISLFKNRNLNPQIIKTSKNSEVVRAMVANNIGYSILNVRPKINYSLDGKRLVRVRISGEQRPMHIGLVTAKNVVLNTVAQAFISRCRAFISDQYIPGMDAPHFYDPHIRTKEDE
ncbi:bacterial regulatory helix-turn-helix, lysR family protein [Acinetobacter baumannii]|uniref:Bacterial regulatory helix-turn-helix, lysR family protein n=1 Tax=Acinetobacter baumannii 625974 TaxID=1310607 RepID=A0A009Q4Y8_ACIBA|nr:LysR family transcriptional regulator [Acinetobacter baumannii]EXC04534.1 bacterial regulatory helix-turn-helix, lysR family protein [Acinetobacter baumannii 625974]KMV06585.1 bacterial regulatory helix-turn-helix, lysR family protein [Acinetobacter baumannii]MBJ9709211.1 LysR family transcriptional regulator [Acinetobacter baumannii]OTR47551.1 LysR family transcriptional regulator [Acinetobacter baumannii]